MRRVFTSPVTSQVLEVGDSEPGVFGLTIFDQKILLDAAEAPAVALAILESAGVETISSRSFSDNGTYGHLKNIKYELTLYIEQREAKAEADRKLRERYALAMLNASRKVNGHPPFERWNDVSSFAQERWLAMAEAAREVLKDAER